MRPEVIEGDVRDVLHTLEDESVQCVVTSPPFWGLRDYGTGTWEGGDEDCNHRTGDQVTQTLHELSVYHRRDSPVGSGVRPGSDNSECKNCGAKKIDKQLGLETTPEEYVENLVSVFQEVKRVLRKDGTVWLNLGDSFMNKNLVGIPWRVAFALQADGWHLRSDIIWNKPNPMPEAVKDRPTRCHEYIFLLTKSKKYYYDNEAIKEPVLDSSIKRSMYGWDCDRPGTKTGPDGIHVEKMGSRFVDPNGRNKRSVWKIDKYGDADTEAMYRQGMHRDRGKNLIATRPDLPSQKEFVDFIRAKTNAKELSEKSGIELSTVEHWFRYDESGFSFPNVEDWTIIRDFVKDKDMDKRLTNIKFHYDSIKESGTRNKRSVWKINTKPYKEAHFATFPGELPEICIKAGTKKGDVVLDIFAGSGTTLRVASKLGRKGIGIELNPKYIKILKKRCRIDSESLLDFGVPLH